MDVWVLVDLYMGMVVWRSSFMAALTPSVMRLYMADWKYASPSLATSSSRMYDFSFTIQHVMADRSASMLSSPGLKMFGGVFQTALLLDLGAVSGYSAAHSAARLVFCLSTSSVTRAASVSRAWEYFWVSF